MTSYRVPASPRCAPKTNDVRLAKRPTVGVHGESVERVVRPRRRQTRRFTVHVVRARRAARGGGDAESTRVREEIQHASPPRNFADDSRRSRIEKHADVFLAREPKTERQRTGSGLASDHRSAAARRRGDRLRRGGIRRRFVELRGTRTKRAALRSADRRSICV